MKTADTYKYVCRALRNYEAAWEKRNPNTIMTFDGINILILFYWVKSMFQNVDIILLYGLFIALFLKKKALYYFFLKLPYLNL